MVVLVFHNLHQFGGKTIGRCATVIRVCASLSMVRAGGLEKEMRLHFTKVCGFVVLC